MLLSFKDGYCTFLVTIKKSCKNFWMICYSEVHCLSSREDQVDKHVDTSYMCKKIQYLYITTKQCLIYSWDYQ